MTAGLHCPACSSEKVYILLDTLHCKRCKNIWREDTKEADYSAGSPHPENSRTLVIKHRTETVRERLEKELNECLRQTNGKFRMDSVPRRAGDISADIFRKYVKQCVKDRVLAERKDRYGIRWYFRPDPPRVPEPRTVFPGGPDRQRMAAAAGCIRPALPGSAVRACSLQRRIG